MTQPNRQDFLQNMKRHSSDTGSLKAQIGQLTLKIVSLIEHLQLYPKDRVAKNSLFRSLAERRKKLEIIQLENSAEYDDIVKTITNAFSHKNE